MGKRFEKGFELPDDVAGDIELVERAMSAALRGQRGQPQLRALVGLVAMGGIALQYQLAQRLNVQASQISRYVDVLVDAKLVQRERDSGPDRRQVAVHLTTDGLDYVMKILGYDGAFAHMHQGNPAMAAMLLKTLPSKA